MTRAFEKIRITKDKIYLCCKRKVKKITIIFFRNKIKKGYVSNLYKKIHCISVEIFS